MRTSSWLGLLLLCSTQCVPTSGRSVVATHSKMRERISNERVEFQKDESSSLQVKPKITVDILMGKAVELQCRNKTSEGTVKWWQTPFGSFEDGKFSNKGPVELGNGNLRIIRTTASHNGLYYCHRVDSHGITIIPYTVNVVTANGIQHKTETYNRSQRMAREGEGSFSQSHFTAAVTSSVLVTFIGAFALGAFSRPYVIKCLSKAVLTPSPKTSSHEHRNGDDVFAVASNEQSLQFDSVFFHSSRNFEDDTVFFAPESSPPFQPKQENEEQRYLEGRNSSLSAIETETSDTLSRRDGGESDREERATAAATDPSSHRQPKRRSRVIKVYDYDEEGKRYSHIKEPEELDENEPRRRHRVVSLTRLSAIMSQAEALDSTNRNPAEPDEPLPPSTV
ncbi:uncharacterized protein LOC113576979 [Electrophorus electricus]|uniref:uncharacterized protein LOC113576979 n=1 Tax=Electrophorus electricus TaxID=8005 RepID=UPI0015D04B9B|nr:uncharacterized protein LOC113576979 [Electrophorus electricus]